MTPTPPLTRCLLALVLWVIPLVVGAQTYYSGGWAYTDQGTSVTIVGVQSSASGAISVPSTLGGKPVTVIADRAFYALRNITSLSIPASVTSMTGRAMQACTGLQSITVNTSNPNFSSSGGVLFNKSKTTLVKCPHTLAPGYVVPSSVTNLGIGSFMDSAITAFTIPSTVTYLSSSAFEGCALLTHITVPSSVKTLGFYVFKNCRALQSVSLTAGIKEVTLEMFASCTSLQSITLPATVETVGVDAFRGCTALEEVFMPAATTIVSGTAFWDCTGLRLFDVHPDNPNLCSVDGVLFNKAKTILRQYPAAKTGTYNVPASVTMIDNLAFAYAQSLTEVRLPDGLTEVPLQAFSQCTGLKRVSIPTGVTKIWSSAFAGCSSMHSVTLPSTLVNIQSTAFTNCTALEQVTIRGNAVSIGSSAFSGCAALQRAVFAGSAPTLGSTVFNGVAPGFTVYFFDGAAGFTAPIWQGYPSVAMGVSSPLVEWLIDHGLPYDANLEQNVGANGINLLIAYAFDLDPEMPELAQMPQAYWDGQRLKMEYVQGRTDVIYRAECSEDLVEWTTEGVTVAPVAESSRVVASTESLQGHGFLRVAVSR